MEAAEIAPGLWRWTCFYGEWKHDVGCVYHERTGEICLIDPLVPPQDAAHFWAALDRDAQRVGGTVHVLVTIFWHTRSARDVVERYGAHVWAPASAKAAVARRAGVVTDPFRPGDPLPGGIEAFASGRPNEVVYWLPEHRALVPGDVLLDAGSGGVRLCPASWLPRGTGHAELRRALTPLLALDPERILVSHGQPVLAGGREALRSALAA
jgi:glyoxylase-like metal-dependent hydrolase (beta-lactamase superfamily II)